MTTVLGDGWVYSDPDKLKKNVPCKHGERDCVRCGTAERNDRPHSTRNGQGKVAALRGNK